MSRAQENPSMVNYSREPFLWFIQNMQVSICTTGPGMAISTMTITDNQDFFMQGRMVDSKKKTVWQIQKKPQKKKNFTKHGSNFLRSSLETENAAC